VDLSEGHRCALDCLLKEEPQLLPLNLGSGQGHSVLDVVKAMEAASNRPVPYVLAGRRSRQAAIMPSQSRACKPGMTSPAQSRGLSEVQRKRVLLIQAKDGELLRDGITPPLWDWAQDNVLAT